MDGSNDALSRTGTEIPYCSALFVRVARFFSPRRIPHIVSAKIVFSLRRPSLPLHRRRSPFAQQQPFFFTCLSSRKPGVSPAFRGIGLWDVYSLMGSLIPRRTDSPSLSPGLLVLVSTLRSPPLSCIHALVVASSHPRVSLPSHPLPRSLALPRNPVLPCSCTSFLPRWHAGSVDLGRNRHCHFRPKTSCLLLPPTLPSC
jgi:hypothetical protein